MIKLCAICGSEFSPKGKRTWEVTCGPGCSNKLTHLRQLKRHGSITVKQCLRCSCLFAKHCGSLLCKPCLIQIRQLKRRQQRIKYRMSEKYEAMISRKKVRMSGALSDCYIRTLLFRTANGRKLIPPGLIAAKRENLKLKRLIKQAERQNKNIICQTNRHQYCPA